MTELVSLLLLSFPAVYAGVLGHKLVRRIDDPAFPELRLANGRRLVFVFMLCVAASLAVSLEFAALKAALAVLLLLVADFPARRRIFGETWGLFTYLFQTLRLWTAALGVWILLALAPVIIRSFAQATLPAAILTLGIAMLWVHFSTQLFPRIVGARPLEDAECEPGFRHVLAGARCRPPSLHVVEARGGHWVNAFALPSLYQPGVLFTARLLEALTPSESQAIFAHELAHLEHFERRRLLIRELGLVALVILLLLALVRFGVDSAVFNTLVWLWPLAVLAFVAVLMARSQAREHEADLRALELMGDPEPIIAALTKVHDLMRLPRRWRVASEGRMSHPSLARRLRAIRDAAAAQGLKVARTDSVQDLVVRDADEPSRVALLTADRFFLLNGVAPDIEPSAEEVLREARDYRSIRYDDLRDLRLIVANPKRRLLVAVDAGGTKMQITIAPEDVDRLKTILAHIDLHVTSTSLEASKQLVKESTGDTQDRVLGALACLVGLIPPVSLPFTLTGVLILVRPSRAALAAAGAIALGAGILALRMGSAHGLDGQLLSLMALVEILLGLLLLSRSISRRRTRLAESITARRVTLGLLGALAVFYILGFAGRLGAPLPVMQVHLWARYELGFVLVMLGLSATLLTWRTRTARLPALAAAAVAAALIAVGSPRFAARFGGDTLLHSPVKLSTQTLATTRVRERLIGGQAADLQLSPSGERFAVRVADWENPYPSDDLGYSVELASGDLVNLAAFHLEFLEDDVAATLSYSQTGELLLRAWHLVSDPKVEYEITLPALVGPILRLDHRTRRWEVVGSDLYEGRATRVTGEIGSSEYVTSDFSLDTWHDSYLSALLVNASDRALAVANHYSTGGLGSLAMALAPISGYATTSEVLAVGQGNTERLALTSLSVWCIEPRARQLEFVCAANDRNSQTRIWSIDATAGLMTGLGSLPGHYYQARRVAGDRVLLGGFGLAPVLIEPQTGRAWSLNLEGEQVPAYHLLALQDRVLALTVPEGDASRVMLYRLLADDVTSP